MKEGMSSLNCEAIQNLASSSTLVPSLLAIFGRSLVRKQASWEKKSEAKKLLRESNILSRSFVDYR
jgi:hypothetical protein